MRITSLGAMAVIAIVLVSVNYAAAENIIQLSESIAFSLQSSLSNDSPDPVFNVIFEDDFENYSPGSFPSSGGWQIIYCGRGAQYQIVVNDVFVSPHNSLKLEGKYSWAAVVSQPFAAKPVMYFEVWVRTAELQKGPYWVNTRSLAWVGFYNKYPIWGRWFGAVGFINEHDGYNPGRYYIVAGGNKIEYTPYQWYKVKVRTDLTARKFDAWVNDILLAENVAINPDGEYNVLALCADNPSNYMLAWFDDVRVFVESDPVSETVTIDNFTETPIGSESTDDASAVGEAETDGESESSNQTETNSEISEAQIGTATVEIKPEVMNLKSKGAFTGFIILPEDGGTLDLNSIECEGVSATRVVATGSGKLVVKFDRRALSGVESGEAELTVSGELSDGTQIEGSDTVRAIDPPKGKGSNGRGAERRAHGGS